MYMDSIIFSVSSLLYTSLQDHLLPRRRVIFEWLKWLFHNTLELILVSVRDHHFEGQYLVPNPVSQEPRKGNILTL